MNTFEHDIRKQFYRFSELYDLYVKKDGRLYLTFEDKGYVEDVDLFLTGCMSFYPCVFMLQQVGVEYRILNDVKKFKTLIDFYDNKIACQNILFKDIEQFYLRSRINDLKIEAWVINPGAGNLEEAIKYFKM